jgi:serine/threonine protein kinase
MMIEDEDILIISDGKPFNPVNEDAEGHVKMVGPYMVGELLGSGGFSEVHAGTNTISNQKVALKFVHKSGIQNLVEAERAASEYRVLSSLSHRNVIKLHSVSSFL